MDLNLEAFTDITATLKLATNEQTYLLYLWMVYVKKTTFERSDDTHDVSIGILANIGQQAMPQVMQGMEQELPLIIYTHQFLQTLDLTDGCEAFYINSMGIDAVNSKALCGENFFDIDVFNFKDKTVTAKAWMNIYLNDLTMHPENYADLQFITQLSQAQISTLLYGKDSKA